MTLMDYTYDDAAEQSESIVNQEYTSWGYRLAELRHTGLRYQLVRALFAGVTFSIMAAGGLVWTLTDGTFSGDASLTRAVLSTALYIVAAGLVLSGAISPRRDMLEVDLKTRVLNFVAQERGGWRKTRRTVRFEEITRIDLAETSLIGELRAVMSNCDYGRITMHVAGRRPVHLIGGDMAELEPLLSQLRSDTGTV